MASIHVKPSGALLVKWRVNGKQHARQFSDRSDAEVFKREKDGEAATRNVLRDTPGIPGWDDRTWTPEALEPEFAVARYLRDIIDRDHSLRVTSKDTYLHSIRNHIEGTDLGRADIRTVTVDQLRAFWAGMPTDRPGAVRNVRQLLSKAFNAAYRESIRDDNPLQRAGLKAPPKTRAVEIVPLTVDDLERLARNALNDRDRAAILLMGYGALRAGEVGGLREQDVDFTKCQLHLRQQTIRARSGKSVAPLKTAAARRTVTLPCSVTDELRKLGATKDGRLFYGVAGDLWTHQNVNNAVQRAAKRAGMRPVHAHLLRHTAVSLFIDDGANPRAIQTMVGHANIQMTLGTYGHLFDHGGAALKGAFSLTRRPDQRRCSIAPSCCSLSSTRCSAA